MSPKFLTDEELIAQLNAALKTQFKDGRVVSWTSNGTSVSKQLMSRHELNATVNALAREARYRIAEGCASIKTAFPRLDGWTRPRGERIASFA